MLSKTLKNYTPGDRKREHYVAWRDKRVYMMTQNACGGIPENRDDRLWNLEGSPFVLTTYKGGRKAEYAVSDGDVKEIMSAILAWCGAVNTTNFCNVCGSPRGGIS